MLKHILRIRLQIALHSFGALDRLRHKLHGLVDAFVGLGATETQEPLAGLAETFASQAGHPEVVVGRFEQIERQAVRGDL